MQKKLNILNICPWKYTCEKKWDDLKPTKSENKRFCSGCNKEVHWVKTKEDFFRLVDEKECVYFNEEIFLSKEKLISEKKLKIEKLKPPIILGIFRHEHKNKKKS